jgi:hypothetical protein
LDRAEIDRVLLERLTLLLGVLVVDFAAASDLVDRARDRALDDATALENPPEIPLRLRRREQEQLARDIRVATLLRELVRDVQELAELVADVDFARRAFDAWDAVERLAELRAQQIQIGAGFGEYARHAAALLLEQGRHHVHGLDELMVASNRKRLRVGKGLLKVCRQLVHAHEWALPSLGTVVT